jgi:hypothetical protein
MVNVYFAGSGDAPFSWSGGIFTNLPLPARSPNLNAYAERWVRWIKEECLAKLILFGEKSLQRAVSNYLEHYKHAS